MVRLNKVFLSVVREPEKRHKGTKNSPSDKVQSLFFFHKEPFVKSAFQNGVFLLFVL